MTPLSEPQCLRVMRERFKIIAPRYDFVTRAFSYGRDRRWKSLGVEKASLSDDAAVLDLACGTGDFSQLVLERLPHARVVGMDLTEPMLHMARKRGLTETVCGDGTSLPFADGSFDCVFVGYGLRNFPDLNEALREIERVTRPGRIDGEPGFLFARESRNAIAVFGLFVRAGRDLGVATARQSDVLRPHSGFAAALRFD